ncbi:MAG: SulP family inorganic anion transporter [Pseudanabaenaceae cyanobacterium SKYGB_i_bin29]|nr:SulP family inorganic anion transporter [Pseudanabaenaceae cyanobacterium SKYG29]MDW8421795.1 SulP family inorganic anion transporter [Pseudanabaenaceae cyanobacterium SKYGB_i_bin29]
MAITNLIKFDNLRNDILGGVTTAIVSVPLALTFGMAALQSPIAGLYGAICVGFFAALFGGTPTLISEPTGPMTVVMTSVVAGLTASAPDRETGIAMAFTVVMLAGLFQVVFGFFKLGKYITLMPYSVVSGFMSGIGVILIILQIPAILGQAAPKGGVIGVIKNLPNLLTGINTPDLILGGLTLAIIFLIPSKWKRYCPPQLLALVLGTIVSVIAFNGTDIRRIGVIPVGLPEFRFPVFTPEQATQIFVDGLVLGMLGCIDTLLTAVIADSLTRTQHDSDKELIGQGIGNIVSGFCGGLPGAGATMGTVVNIQTGAKTAVSGICRALVLLVIVLGAAPLMQNIPMAVLAGIAVKVGIDILDWSFLKRAHIVSLRGALIMYGVLALTVLVDLIVAVGVGVFIANILTIEKLSNLQSQEVRTITDSDDDMPLSALEKELLNQAKGKVLLFYLSGPMIFGVAKAIAREHNAMQKVDTIIIDLGDVPMLGVTASLAIENVIKEAVEEGRNVFLAGAKGATKIRLQRLGVLDLIPPENQVADRRIALETVVAGLRTADVAV